MDIVAKESEAKYTAVIFTAVIYTAVEDTAARNTEIVYITDMFTAVLKVEA